MDKKKIHLVESKDSQNHYPLPNRNQDIVNPSTGTPVFGQFPAIRTQQIHFESGPIKLRYGEHYGHGRGWGMVHIWKARFPSILTITEAQPAVIHLIEKIIIPGATIHYEFGLGSAVNRSSIFRSTHGIAVVEQRFNGKNEIFYSVVTAIVTTKVKGPIIGSL